MKKKNWALNYVYSYFYSSVLHLFRPCCEDFKLNVKQNQGTVAFTSTQVRVDCVLTPSVENFKSLKKVWKETIAMCIKTFITDTIEEKESIELDEGGPEAFRELRNYAETGMCSG